jgi:hypothetical protein
MGIRDLGHGTGQARSGREKCAPKAAFNRCVGKRHQDDGAFVADLDDFIPAPSSAIQIGMM